MFALVLHYISKMLSIISLLTSYPLELVTGVLSQIVDTITLYVSAIVSYIIGPLKAFLRFVLSRGTSDSETQGTVSYYWLFGPLQSCRASFWRGKAQRYYLRTTTAISSWASSLYYLPSKAVERIVNTLSALAKGEIIPRCKHLLHFCLDIDNGDDLTTENSTKSTLPTFAWVYRLFESISYISVAPIFAYIGVLSRGYISARDSTYAAFVDYREEFIHWIKKRVQNNMVSWKSYEETLNKNNQLEHMIGDLIARLQRLEDAQTAEAAEKEQKKVKYGALEQAPRRKISRKLSKPRPIVVERLQQEKETSPESSDSEERPRAASLGPRFQFPSSPIRNIRHRPLLTRVKSAFNLRKK